MQKGQKHETIKDYIKAFPKDTQVKLNEVHKFIRDLVPEAEETISYNMPTFKLDGKYLIYFAGYKNHISIYPYPSGSKKFEVETKKYKASKGTIKFPLNQEIPWELIKKIVKFRLEGNLKETSK